MVKSKTETEVIGMPIFESIRTAEENAERMRAKAHEDAKAVLDRARADADAEAARLRAETDARIEAIEAESARKAEAEAKRIVADGKTADAETEKRAAKRTGRALAAIMKKVTGA